MEVGIGEPQVLVMDWIWGVWGEPSHREHLLVGPVRLIGQHLFYDKEREKAFSFEKVGRIWSLMVDIGVSEICRR